MYKVLDCTLRDGGYYNGWDFDDKITSVYFQAMEQLPIDYVEIGYRNNPSKGYEGRYFYCPQFVLERCKSMMPSKKIAVMFNEKEVKPQDVHKLLEPCKGLVDIVRIAVAPNKFKQAIELSAAIRAEGFEAGVNLMYMSSLLNSGTEEVFDTLATIEGIVNYFSLVDSYGGVYPEDVARLIKQCKAVTNVPVGFHGHNNIELVFANTLAAINAGCDVVDATVTGMGRGAGNLKTELLLTHQATREGRNVDFNSLADVVSNFEQLQDIYGWGTNLPYMVSGTNSLPQKDVMDWVSKRTYSINSIIRGLSNQSKGQEDNLKLPVFDGSKHYKTAVIVGGGQNAVAHAEAIKKFIDQNNDICIIHASSKNSWIYTDINVPQFFCLVGNEGHRLENVFSDVANINPICILPPFPRKMGTYIPKSVINDSYELGEVNFADSYKDSHTALAVQLAKELQVQDLYVAGYDGYLAQPVLQKEQDLLIENNYLFACAEKHFGKLTSLTFTNYKTLNIQSVYSLIS
ncbi:hypothetical protein GCM10027037_35340 [Mucilaginibacter koreensis]